MDVSKLKVADLKKELKNRGLSTTGNKNELQERLQVAMLESDTVLDPNVSELLDEDVLNDDELDEEDKSLLADETSHIEDESLLSTSSHSNKVDISETSQSTTKPAPAPEKKIVLKRTAPITAPDTTTTEAPAADEKSSPKVAKITQLTAAERLELRTKKFGLTAATTPVNTDLKKQARAERFGLKVTATAVAAEAPTAAKKDESKPASNKIDTSNLEEVSVEVLKKRAERFGTVSSKLVSAVNEEKLAQRQNRFGITTGTTTAANTTTATKAATVSAEEKARLRLERFKTEVK